MDIPKHLLVDLTEARTFERSVDEAAERGEDVRSNGSRADALDWMQQSGRALADWLRQNPA